MESPYGSGNPFNTESAGYVARGSVPKKRTSNWIKIGIPVAIIVIAAAVIGGVLGSRHAKTSSSGSSGGKGSSGNSPASVDLAVGRFATGTESKYMIPVYPSTVSCIFFHVFIPPKLLCRLTQLLSPPRPSILTLPGRPTHSNLAIPAPLLFDRIDPDS